MMTDQEIRDRLIAEFDKTENPDRADLKTRCAEAAGVQWWAQNQLEMLHIFNSPRCALTEEQFQTDWSTHVLSQIHWPTIRENTVAEALARDQLKMLRASLVDMVRFLKPPTFSKKRSPEDWVWVFEFLGEPQSWRTITRRNLRTGPGSTTKSIAFDVSQLPSDYDDTLTRPKTKSK